MSEPIVLQSTETSHFVSYNNESSDLLAQAAEYVAEKEALAEHNDVTVVALGFYRDSEEKCLALTMTLELS